MLSNDFNADSELLSENFAKINSFSVKGFISSPQNLTMSFSVGKDIGLILIWNEEEDTIVSKKFPSAVIHFDFSSSSAGSTNKGLSNGLNFVVIINSCSS